MASTASKSSDKPSNTGGTGSTARATALTIGLVFASRILGLIRGTVLSYLFGQSAVTATFLRAFAVPDLIALVIAGGALSAVFIPVFADYWNAKREDEAWRMFGSVMSIVGVIVAVLVVLMEIGVVPLTQLLNPKFSADAIQETASLTRILLPVQWCLMVGGLMMGTLYARKRFFVPGFGPLLYNAGQIVGCVVGGVLFPRSVQGLSFMAWGALLGGFIGSILLPIIDLARAKAQWKFGFNLKHPGVIQVGKLMLPVLLGQSLSQLNMWLTGFFTGDDFRYPALTNAYNLTQAPIGIFAQAFGIVLLPTISAFAASQEWIPFRKSVSQGLRRVLFLTIPCSVLMAALAVPLVRLFYKGHAFTENDVPAAADALICYSISTFAWSGSTILQRGFWAVKDTKTPIYITTPLVIIYVILAWIYTRFIDPNGYLGLALGTSLLGIVSFVLFLFYLQKRVGTLNMRAIVTSSLKITAASLLAGVATYGISILLQQYLSHGKGGSALTVILAGSVGIIAYAIFSLVLRVPELRGIGEMFRRGNRSAPASGNR